MARTKDGELAIYQAFEFFHRSLGQDQLKLRFKKLKHGLLLRERRSKAGKEVPPGPIVKPSLSHLQPLRGDERGVEVQWGRQEALHCGPQRQVYLPPPRKVQPSVFLFQHLGVSAWHEDANGGLGICHQHETNASPVSECTAGRGN